MKIIIVEDEKEQQELLKTYLRKTLGEKNIAYELSAYDNAEDFLKEYEKGASLVFMDIELPGMNGMQASRKLREIDREVLLIFVTNMAQFAIQGYEVDATDFIVKPINLFAFSLKLDKALRILATRAPSKQILISVDGEEKTILSKDVIYVEVINHDLYYHTLDRTYRTRSTMTKVMTMLKGLPFSRCHVGYLVNLSWVKSATKNEIELDNGEVLSLARTRRKEFLEDLARYLSGGNA